MQAVGPARIPAVKAAVVKGCLLLSLGCRTDPGSCQETRRHHRGPTERQTHTPVRSSREALHGMAHHDAVRTLVKAMLGLEKVVANASSNHLPTCSRVLSAGIAKVCSYYGDTGAVYHESFVTASVHTTARGLISSCMTMTYSLDHSTVSNTPSGCQICMGCLSCCYEMLV